MGDRPAGIRDCLRRLFFRRRIMKSRIPRTARTARAPTTIPAIAPGLMDLGELEEIAAESSVTKGGGDEGPALVDAVEEDDNEARVQVADTVEEGDPEVRQDVPATPSTCRIGEVRS